jgi:hypothetical protein
MFLVQVDPPESSVQVLSTSQNLNSLRIVNCDRFNPEGDSVALVAKFTKSAMDSDLFSSGMSNGYVCIASMVAPFGRRTVNGF